MVRINMREFIYCFMVKRATWNISVGTSGSFGIVIVSRSKLSIQTLVELSINDAVVTGVTGTRGIDIYLLLEEGNGYLLPIPTEPYLSPRTPS